MIRYIIGAAAAAALALAGCNDRHPGQGYSGTAKQANGNDTAYQNGFDRRADLHNDGRTGAGADTSVSGVSGNGDTDHDSDFHARNDNAANSSDNAKDAATGQGLSGSEQNPAETPKGTLMSITGTVKDSGSGGMTLVTGSKGELKLNTGDFTRVVGINGMSVKPGDIKEGSEVRTTYKFDGKDNKAMSITITKAPMANAADKGTLHRTDDQRDREQKNADPGNR